MENNKAYTLRQPEFDDAFLMFRILSKVGVKKLKGCFESEEVKNAIRFMFQNKTENSNNEDADVKKNEEMITSIGWLIIGDMLSMIMENMDVAKEDIYAFLSRLSGMKTEEIAKLNLVEAYEMIMDVIKLEGFRDFFMRVYESFK